MASMDLNDYYYFVHVVEKGGFTRAAEALGIPKSRLSRHVAQLEERLDAVLIRCLLRRLAGVLVSWLVLVAPALVPLVFYFENALVRLTSELVQTAPCL